MREGRGNVCLFPSCGESAVWGSGGKGKGNEWDGRLTIHPLVRMHRPVPEILPAIAEEYRDAEPHRRLHNPIRRLRDPNLPRRKAARRVPADEERLNHPPRHHRRLAPRHNTSPATESPSVVFQRLANGPRIDAQPRQRPRDGPASVTDPPSPDRDIVVLLSVEIGGVGQMANGQPQRGLHRLLDEHGPQHFDGGDAVALFEFRGRVEAVLGEVVVGGDDVEEEGHEPVGGDGEEEGEVEVGEVGEEGGLAVEGVGGERGEGGGLVGHGDVSLIRAWGVGGDAEEGAEGGKGGFVQFHGFWILFERTVDWFLGFCDVRPPWYDDRCSRAYSEANSRPVRSKHHGKWRQDSGEMTTSRKARELNSQHAVRGRDGVRDDDKLSAGLVEWFGAVRTSSRWSI